MLEFLSALTVEGCAGGVVTKRGGDDIKQKAYSTHRSYDKSGQTDGPQCRRSLGPVQIYCLQINGGKNLWFCSHTLVWYFLKPSVSVCVSVCLCVCVPVCVCVCLSVCLSVCVKFKPHTPGNYDFL